MSKAKSAYSIPGKKGKLDTHIIVVWGDNEAGVLARVVGLFSGRGYNIESLAVAEVDPKLIDNLYEKSNCDYTFKKENEPLTKTYGRYLENIVNLYDVKKKSQIL